MPGGGAPLKRLRVCLAISVSAATLVFCDLSLPLPIRGQSDFIVVDQDVPVKMRDGVTLKADVYHPKADGKYPVLLERTPYDKSGQVKFGRKAAARG